MQQPPKKIRRKMLETSPFLCSLLGPEPAEVSIEPRAAAPPDDVTTSEGGLPDRPRVAARALSTDQFCCDSAAASVPIPQQIPLSRRLLTSCDREDLERLLQAFLACVEPPADENNASSMRSGCSKAYVVVRAKWAIHRLMHFAAQLRGLAAVPVPCKEACVQASAAGCILLQCSYMYDIAAGRLNLEHGVSLDASDLCWEFPAVSSDLWTKCAQLAHSLKQLLKGLGAVTNGEPQQEVIVLALLQAILVTSPEVETSSDVGDEALAAVADIQLFYMLLLRRHCEAAYSYEQAADLEPTLLFCIRIVKRLASLVQKALTCHNMYSDCRFSDICS